MEVWPHELLRADFEQMLYEGIRQENIYKGNVGEFRELKVLYDFFSTDVLPTIIDNKWVYSGVEKFATTFAIDCFRNLQLGGQEVYAAQQRKVEVDETVRQFIRDHQNKRIDRSQKEIHLTKASDFIHLFHLKQLPYGSQKLAQDLLKRIEANEDLHLRVTLRAIGDCYEIAFTRIMFVVRRAMKANYGNAPAGSDDTLQQPPNYIDWLVGNTDSSHILNKLFVQQREFYKIARNVRSHHLGLLWLPDIDSVVLTDKGTSIIVHIDDFLQRYRYLSYFCELGLRGILAAFSERERGVVANKLIENYKLTFPSDWTGGVKTTVVLYPV